MGQDFAVGDWDWGVDSGGAGGTRVTETSTTLAIVHGVFAQLVFATMMVLVAETSERFFVLQAVETAGASSDRLMTAGLVGAMVVQLILGATVRHRNEGVLVHITMAVMVTVLVLACGFRAWGVHGGIRPLHKLGVGILVIVFVQLVLGVLALVLWTGNARTALLTSAVFTTLHQMNGALLLAACAALAVWTWRMLKPVGVPVVAVGVARGG